MYTPLYYLNIKGAASANNKKKLKIKTLLNLTYLCIFI